MKHMSCWFCSRMVKVEGPDAITFIHKINNQGICEDCLLLCLQVYSETKRKLLSPNFEVKDDATPK